MECETDFSAGRDSRIGKDEIVERIIDDGFAADIDDVESDLWSRLELFGELLSLVVGPGAAREVGEEINLADKFVQGRGVRIRVFTILESGDRGLMRFDCGEEFFIKRL